ncbi:unnamed protein product, partial [Polarella glacialis]
SVKKAPSNIATTFDAVSGAPLSSPLGVSGTVVGASAPSRGRACADSAPIGLAIHAVSQPAPGQFDEAILAALAALPQQSLVDVLRRLRRKRPDEVAMVFGGSSQASSPSKHVDLLGEIPLEDKAANTPAYNKQSTLQTA